MKSQLKFSSLALLFVLSSTTLLCGQNLLTPRADLTPGTVGQATKLMRRDVFGYVQPTELVVPKKTRVAFYDETEFQESVEHRLKVGLRIGDVYRFKITMIKGFEGLELFPSIELIDRLYPPQEKYMEFPVPVHITQQDLVNALSGQLVTKVIYLEDPNQALPVRSNKDIQRVLHVGAGEDPVRESVKLGRPVAILRIGSRTPDESSFADFFTAPVIECDILEKGECCDGARCCPEGKPWPKDEYLCDGGDKNQKTKIAKDFSIRGLDIEDTIVHFDTLDGERKVSEANRVCIYAPRFAALVKKYGISVAHQNEQFADVNNKQSMLKANYTDIPSTSTQQYQPKGTQTTKSSSMFRDQTRGLPVVNSIRAHEFIGDLKLYEDFQVVKVGRMKNNESLRLNIGLQAAQEWDHYAAVQVVVDNKKSNVAKRIQSAEELRTYKPMPGSSKIRIVKLADKKDAQPGELVEFTLRFDNIGTKKVGNVTIMDNLTTRLEFVPDSATCSLKHNFLTQPNEKDSLLLRWEIIDPVEPGQGGVIRFKCLVR